MITRTKKTNVLLMMLSALGGSSSVWAETATQTNPSGFCTQFKIDESEDEFLTAQEQVQKMEQAFVDSIDREEACIVKTPGNGGVGQNGHGEGSEGEGMEGEDAEGDEGESESEEQQVADKREDKTLNNGAVPKDIPSAENDSVLEAQIRKAAESETDPVKRKKLWNEYRRYKGLKIK